MAAATAATLAGRSLRCARRCHQQSGSSSQRTSDVRLRRTAERSASSGERSGSGDDDDGLATEAVVAIAAAIYADSALAAAAT